MLASTLLRTVRPRGASLLGGGLTQQTRFMANRAKANATIGPNILNHNTINVATAGKKGGKGRERVIKSIPAKAEQNRLRVIQVKIKVQFPPPRK